jgi:hypothetical protein
MKLILVAFAALLLSLSIGCRRVGIAFVDKNSEALVPEAGDSWLMFDLQPLEQSGAFQGYDCTFEAEGKTAHFQFEVNSRATSGDPPMAFGSGKFIAVAGSDASVFLRKLQKPLEAKTLPARPKRVAELPFTAAVLGTNQSHSKDGGFFTKPPGHWTAMKIFIGNHDDPAEVFLNFNTVLHKGEFSIKDPDYGDEVLKEFARVL